MANKKMKTCKSCEAEVSKSAKVCPKCGARLKMRFITKALIGIGVLAALAVAGMPSKDQIQAKLQEIEKAQPSDLSAHRELVQIFGFISKRTDIQRENKEKEIKGKIVEWELPVYEVKKTSENVYRVQTSASPARVGTFVNLHARNDDEARKIEALTTGDYVKFKGQIEGVSLRNIDIGYGVLMSN